MTSKDWNAGGKPAGRWEHSPNSDAQDRELQRGIDAAMREVIANPYRTDFGSMGRSTKAWDGLGRTSWLRKSRRPRSHRTPCK
jgi:hypothetical protein